MAGAGQTRSDLPENCHWNDNLWQFFEKKVEFLAIKKKKSKFLAIKKKKSKFLAIFLH